MNCFIYARKSTESEDRQVLSIEAQLNELKAVALKQGLNIVEVFTEAKSAKAPGRPVFNNLMKRVFEEREISLLCWKLDRLARNPVDGGSLIWAVEEKRIKQIITPHRSFNNYGDDKFWMQLEFGIAKKYVDDLSDNVKRGNRAKLEKGILPGKAPLGYLNDKENKTIINDPERFNLVRRIWEVILSGDYNIRELLRTIEEDWGLITPQYKTSGGRALTQSGLYRILNNPFYYGAIKRKGELYPGIHAPMISKEEYDRVQEILGRSCRCKKKKDFAFTGLIQCAECGGMITAEDTINRHGYLYTYYHCSKRKGGIHNRCKQKCIRVEELENQIVSFLARISVSDKFAKWCLRRLANMKTDEQRLKMDQKISLEKSLNECKRKLDNLLDLKLKDLLTDEEYLAEKAKITDKKINLERSIGQFDQGCDIWLEPCQAFFSFLTLAKKRFQDGDTSIKRQILTAIGSNLLLKDSILLIEAKRPFKLVAENGNSPPGLGLVHEVRTLFSDPMNHFYIPDLTHVRK